MTRRPVAECGVETTFLAPQRWNSFPVDTKFWNLACTHLASLAPAVPREPAIADGSTLGLLHLRLC